jgi:hypothetical protein
VRTVVGLGVLATAVVTFLLLAPEHADQTSRVGYAAILAVPAGLAAAALVDRPVLLMPAALLSVALSPMLFSGILLLLVPGIAYACSYVIGNGRGPIPRTLAVASVLAPIVLTILAVMLLFTSGTTEVCVSDANSTSCSTAHSPSSVAFEIVLAVCAVATGWFFATPVRRIARSRRGHDSTR